ncbi:unnamed protein product [Caenorhabditis angaria]|uniref:Protein kinase domain-containing protein n=1 Tax=Caenorhabditis angaria TaxID=860376 RepID=A0A9P1ITC8_9PELO|nr:unnamed protein product [Caenorhabditis angaria]
MDDFKHGQVCNDWIIWKNCGHNGYAHVYQVSDMKKEVYGTMYAEKLKEDRSSTIGSCLDFLIEQQAMGNGYKFVTVIDSKMIEEDWIYMITQFRPGPSLEQLINCQKSGGKFDPVTCTFFAIDMLQAIETIIESGHVLQSFEKSHWRFDVNSRIFYLSDISDLAVCTDRRANVFRKKLKKNPQLFSGASASLNWKGDIKYAPISFIEDGKDHRMSEMDMLEVAIYVFYDLVSGKLPWETSQDLDKILKMKEEFLDYRRLQCNDSGFNIVLRNMVERLKQAKIEEVRLASKPTMFGAWCPHGLRGPAQSSAFNYDKMHKDFRQLITNHQPKTINFRDAMLCFEVELKIEDMSENVRKKLERKELLRMLKEQKEEMRREEALIEHYSVMKEDDMMQENILQQRIREMIKAVKIECGKRFFKKENFLGTPNFERIFID